MMGRTHDGHSHLLEQRARNDTVPAMRTHFAQLLISPPFIGSCRACCRLTTGGGLTNTKCDCENIHSTIWGCWEALFCGRSRLIAVAALLCPSAGTACCVPCVASRRLRWKASGSIGINPALVPAALPYFW